MTPTTDATAARIALSSLPAMGPARLRWLLAEQSPVAAWEAVRRDPLVPPGSPAPRGVTDDLVRAWRTEARRLDPQSLLAAHLDAGVQVLVPDDTDWPFADDPEPPVALYVRGDRSVIPRPGPRGSRPPSLAIVGTRRCTAMGRGIAREFAREATAAGCSVVSGLALGIDGAAHEGALAATGGRPVAVVANGLDRISPATHRRLAGSVAERGAVISESPLGTPGDRWRFPARNRLIAGLCDVLLVVESHERGGALITVDEAIERGRVVGAVPGSIRSPASSGTNQLLVDGAVPVVAWESLATLLGCAVEGAALDRHQPLDLASSVDLGPPVPAAGGRSVGQVLLAEVGVGPVDLADVAVAQGIALEDLVVVAARLMAAGALRQHGTTVTEITP